MKHKETWHSVLIISQKKEEKATDTNLCVKKGRTVMSQYKHSHCNKEMLHKIDER